MNSGHNYFYIILNIKQNTKMKKIGFVVLIMCLLVSTGFAQIGEALGKLGLGGAKPESSYSFSSSISYKVNSVDKKGKSQWINTKYYFADKGTAIGMKIIDANDPDVKKGMNSMDFMILDIGNAKMFNFMNNDGNKMVMGIGMRPDKLTEMVEKENDKISVTKTSETKNILGYECEGYSIKSDKDKSDVIMWVSKKKVEPLANLGEQMGKAFAGGSFGGKQTNYYAYNAHPELAKIAKEGRGILGYTSKTPKGEVVEMELTDVKPNDSYSFKASDYKSMF